MVLAPSRPSRRAALPIAVALATSSMTALAGSAPGALDPATDLDAVVVTAAGFEQKLTDAPASISIVTRSELVKRPYLTLIDAVRDLEGVDVGETSDKTGQKTISIRGMGADYTLLLIDGRRQNNHGDIYPNAFAGNQFNHIPPLETIERIEVIRGPASTLYGADALGGVINIITRKVSERWAGSATVGRSFQQDAAFGNDATFDFSLQGPLLRDVLGLSVRGSRYDRDASNPEYGIVVDPAGVEHERAIGFGGGGRTVDNTNASIGFGLGWTPSDRQHLKLDYDRSEQEYDNRPFENNLGTLAYPLGTVDSIETVWRAQSGQVAPRVGYLAEQEFTRAQWALTHEGQWSLGSSWISLARIETANNGRTLPFTVGERRLLQQMWDGVGEYAAMSEAERRTLAESTFLPRPHRTMESRQTTLDLKFDMPLDGFGGFHHLVFGGQAIDGELEDGVFGMESGDSGDGVTQEHDTWSLFAEDNWTPFDALTLTVGLRHDDHNLFGGHLSPRAYGVYTISGGWTLKGGVSTGYKTPKTTDLYDGIIGFGAQGTLPFVGNPELEPETSVNSELALYWTSADGANTFNITAFRNDFKDKIERGEATQSCASTSGVRPCVNIGEFETLGYSSYSQSVNIDKARIRGLEIAGLWRIAAPLALRANYTWTDSQRLSGEGAGLPLTGSAEHMANAALDWTVTDRFSLQLVGEVRTDRYRGSADSNGDPLYYAGYEVLHLAAQYRFNEHASVAGRVNNLLDEDFTSFRSGFLDNGDGSWTPQFFDDYNNKDKARNLWLSLNVAF